MQALRERLTLLLLLLLPFHAFLVTLATRMVKGYGHPPMFSLWKEVLLSVILLIAAIEILQGIRRTAHWLSVFRIDLIDTLILGFFLIAFFVTLTTHADPHMSLYGIRYDIIPFLILFLCRRVPWSSDFRDSAESMLIMLGGGVVILGLIFLFLPQSFFTLLGYSDLHSLYMPEGPIAAFQQIEGLNLRRMQSVMSGPNHLGLWLLIPASLIILDTIHARIPHQSYLYRAIKFLSVGERQQSYFSQTLLAVIVLGIILSFSRAAWLGVLIVILVAFTRHIDGKKYKQAIVRYSSAIIFLFLLFLFLFPDVVLRFSSSSEHIRRPIAAVEQMIYLPFGTGLGTAGPASNRLSDPCVYLDADADTGWAQAHPDLCVFAGATQVQPLSRDCNCPLIPENWYLQIGVELGWIGLIIFVWLTIVILRKLAVSQRESLGEGVYVAFMALSVAALFLHAWEDAAIAYTVMILVSSASCFGGSPRLSLSSTPVLNRLEE